MNKSELKQRIACSAYNIGFGAKKNFASYDILRKTNEYISLISMIIGILALNYEFFNTKSIATTLLIAGVCGLYLIRFEHKKEDYNKNGILFTQLYNQLHKLYLKVDQISVEEMYKFENEINLIEKQFYDNSISDQVWFSDWLAHYKFFVQLQSDWISKELKLKLFEDKLPLNFLILLIISVIITSYYIINHCTQ